MDSLLRYRLRDRLGLAGFTEAWLSPSMFPTPLPLPSPKAAECCGGAVSMFPADADLVVQPLVSRIGVENIEGTL